MKLYPFRRQVSSQ